MWTDALQGVRKHEGCNELFNCGTNTKLEFPVACKRAMCSYHIEGKGVALVIPNEPTEEMPKNFAVAFFMNKNIFAYNIGYCDSIPGKAEVEERIQDLQKWADEEWNEHQDSIEESQDLSCQDILAAAAEEQPLFLQVHVRDWYMLNYPDDELAKEMRPETTFKDIVTALIKNENVYNVLSDTIRGEDTVVRERVFTELADKLHIDYDVVYDAWLHIPAEDSISPGY